MTTMYRGDTKTIVLTIDHTLFALPAEGIAGYGLFSMFKRSSNDADADAVLSFIGEGSPSVVDAGSDSTDATVSVTIPSDAFDSFPWAEAELVYDLRIVDSDSNVSTVLVDTLTVLVPVTRATS